MNSNSFLPRLHEYPFSTFGAQRVHRNTAHEIAVRRAAERWTMRSRPSR